MENSKKPPQNKQDKDYPGYPHYPSREDIMNPQLNLEKTPLDEEEKDELDSSGLDIPGADGDDALEAIGEEDEENNYYSLGGDRHDETQELDEDDD